MKKTAIVTGSTKGISWAIGRALLDEGYFVIFNYANDVESAQNAIQAMEKEEKYENEYHFIKQRLERKEDIEKFTSAVLRVLLRFPWPDAIVTDIWSYYEESMKVVEKDGRLTGISKAVPREAALGASIDVYKFSARGGEAFFNKCAAYIEDKKELKKWSEVALKEILTEVEFRACPLEGRWLEVDNYEDLRAAERLFAKEEKDVTKLRHMTLKNRGVEHKIMLCLLVSYELQEAA